MENRHTISGKTHAISMAIFSSHVTNYQRVLSSGYEGAKGCLGYLCSLDISCSMEIHSELLWVSQPSKSIDHIEGMLIDIIHCHIMFSEKQL